MNVVCVSSAVCRALQLQRAPLRFLPLKRRPLNSELGRDVLLCSNGRSTDLRVSSALARRHAEETRGLRECSGAFAFARVIGAGSLENGNVELRWASGEEPPRYRVVEYLRSAWALWPTFYVIDAVELLSHSLPLPIGFRRKDREACNRLWVQALSLR